jgi:hypothetical protein
MDKSKKENMDKSILLGIVSSTQNATYSEKGKRWRSAVVVGVGGAVVVGGAVLLMNTTTPVPANQSHRKKEALVLILLVIVVTHQRKTSKKKISRSATSTTNMDHQDRCHVPPVCKRVAVGKHCPCLM